MPRPGKQVVDKWYFKPCQIMEEIFEEHMADFNLSDGCFVIDITQKSLNNVRQEFMYWNLSRFSRNINVWVFIGKQTKKYILIETPQKCSCSWREQLRSRKVSHQNFQNLKLKSEYYWMGLAWVGLGYKKYTEVHMKHFHNIYIYIYTICNKMAA